MIEVPLAVWLLLLAPVAAILIGFFVVRPLKPEWTHWPILVSCLVVTACASWLTAWVYAGQGLDTGVCTWMTAGERWGLSFGFRIDGLGVSVLAMASLVGGLIHVYAIGYMRGEEGFSRFFLAFHLFFLGMIGLLVSNNLIQMYLFWELMGAASYMLIGYFWRKESARKAAVQAFLVNRVGDFAFMLAVIVLGAAAGGQTRLVFLGPLMQRLGGDGTALVGWLLFIAAVAKSAQLPLYFWLPDAMEGPTPVSALMHAATMVTAGIFLLARSWPLISAVPPVYVGSFAVDLRTVIAAVGALTAIFSAVVACSRKDLKRILAYSTVSHLGLMAMGLGLGQVTSSVFHLVTHGFFKATLFLCAGNIAHAIHKSTATVDETGGLRKEMKWTFLCFTVAALSASGIWPFGGFYSKDAILDAALHHGGAFAVAGLLISALSAFYMGRMLFLVFFGDRPEQKGRPHSHEGGPELGAPIGMLALGAAVIGLAGPHIEHLMHNGWASEVPFPALPEFSLKAAGLGTGAALLGWAAAYAATMVFPSWDWQWRRSSPRLERAFDADLGVKPFMLGIARAVSRMADWIGGPFDKGAWDGFLESLGTGARNVSETGGRVASGAPADILWWLMTGSAALLALAVWK